MKKVTKKHKFHIKTGDKVVVIAGNNKGKTGLVTQVLREVDRAVVGGLNMIKKHIKPSNTNPKGGIVEKEAPIHISNLLVADPKTGEATRIGRRVNKATGKLERFSKKTGEAIKNNG